MNRVLFYISGSIAITSCSGDIPVFIQPEQSTSAMLLSAYVQPAIENPRSTHQSEGAILGATLPPGSEIGVMLYHTENGVDYSPYPTLAGVSGENMRWINKGDDAQEQWRWVDNENMEQAVLLNDVSGQLFAYFPYQSEATPLLPVAEMKASSSVTIRPGTTDYLFGKATSSVNNRQPVANISMHHAMAMVSFVLGHEPEYKGECVLQSLVLKNISSGATLNLVENTTHPFLQRVDLPLQFYNKNTDAYLPINGNSAPVIQFKGESNYGLSQIPEAGNPLMELSNFHLFVVPEEGISSVGETGIYLELVVDNILYSIPFPNDRPLADGSRGYSWKRGANTLYRITITKNNVNLTYVGDDYEAGGDSDFEFG